MFRLTVNPGRALTTQFVYRPLWNASIPHQAVKFLTTKTAKSPEAKALDRLKEKIKTAKANKKKLEKNLKEKEKDIKALVSQRKKDAVAEEKAKLKEKKELAKHQAYLKDTLREPRPYTVQNYFAKVTKTPVTTLTQGFSALSESEVAKYQKATDEYNHALKSILTPKPVLGPTSGYQKFVSENYPPNVTAAEAMRKLADEWKQLSKEEKESYHVPEVEVERIKKIQRDWEQTREKEYPKLVKFKQEYKFTI
ncbi:GCF1 [Candida margitis]|uniref:GCF1 n=1 Tax=Candida margitis TaxID=1775924 RepID=UPI002227F800|nr:GCF1 [Candida margitis]KAI5954133.1 GCF1 [Candida margitis]